MKLQGITKNLQEVSGEDILGKIINKRDLQIYWGTATTGKPHIAYFLPIFRIKNFFDSGCSVTILLADIHAFLDNLKAPIEKIKHRSVYYKKIIISMLKSIDVDVSRVNFVEVSSYQKKSAYFLDILKIAQQVSVNDARRAGSEVVKQLGNAKLSSLVYPVMQALDEEYLKVDAQFGGVDQRKIFMFAKEFLPLLKYKKRIHLMNPMIPGLNSDKMSSSDKGSKIDLLETERDITDKINTCDINFNDLNCGFLALFKFIIFPWCEIKSERVCIAGVSHTKESFIEAFTNSKLCQKELKEVASSFINKMIAPIRNIMYANNDIINNAYGEE